MLDDLQQQFRRDSLLDLYLYITVLCGGDTPLADRTYEWFTREPMPPCSSLCEYESLAKLRVQRRVRYLRGKTLALTTTLYCSDSTPLTVPFKVIEPFPYQVIENGAAVPPVTLVDLTARKNSPRLLKVPSEFTNWLRYLYPFEVRRNRLLKDGRDIAAAAILFHFSDATVAEMHEAVRFHSDPLDFTLSSNGIYSAFRTGAYQKNQSAFVASFNDSKAARGSLWFSAATSPKHGAGDGVGAPAGYDWARAMNDAVDSLYRSEREYGARI